MQLLFLGTGTSAGVPAIACDCDVCTSPDPRDRRLRPSACLSFVDPGGEARTILIDAGPDLREQAITHRLTRCDAVLLTHHHVDHIWGLDELRRFNVVMRAPIDVYGEAETLANARRIFRHIFEAHRNVNRSFVATLLDHAVRPGAPFELFGLRVTPIRLLHGRLPILGFRFDGAEGLAAAGPPLPLAYCTDVSAIPPESWRHLQELDTLVLDALRHRAHPTHMSIDRAVATAHEIGARQTWFVHMAHDISHAETDPSLPDGINLAFDGLRVGEAPAPGRAGDGGSGAR